MLTTILIIYLIGALITSAIAAYGSGIEQAHLKVLNPQQYQVNWVNNFFQALLWMSHWFHFLARKKWEGNVTPQQAANYFGVSLGQAKWND